MQKHVTPELIIIPKYKWPPTHGRADVKTTRVQNITINYDHNLSIKNGENTVTETITSH